MLSIGEFSRVTHLSVRTLRRHHEAGLLVPAAVDPVTGYRSYGPDQIPTAQVIHQLRELDVPLADVRLILAAKDPGDRAELVADHLHRLEEQLDRTRAAVTSLRRLLDPAPPALAVEVRTQPGRRVAGVAADVALEDVLGWYAGAMAELDVVVPTTTGAPGGVFGNELFEVGHGSALVYVPTDRPVPTRGRVHGVDLPAAELAVAVHRGPHDDIGVTYGELGAWVVEHALSVAGPVHERYLVGPRDGVGPDQWRTEIGWPVFRVGR